MDFPGESKEPANKMSIRVKISASLRHPTTRKGVVEVAAHTVAECLDNLEADFPGIKQRLCDERGGIHSFINIYVNGEDVHYLQGLSTPLKSGDEVIIVPAIAGG
jgi:molybdopterin synthase sulfur carrier subunit